MGTTTEYGYPYPEGSGLVIGGDDAMEALALAVNNSLRPSYATNSVTAGVIAAGAQLLGIAAPSGSSDWSHPNANTVQYFGPTRLHHISVDVELFNGAGFDSTLSISRGGVSFVTREVLGGGTKKVLRAEWLVDIANGDWFQFAVNPSASVNVIRGNYRIFSLEPKGV